MNVVHALENNETLTDSMLDSKRFHRNYFFLNTYSQKYHKVIKKGFIPVDEIMKLNDFYFDHATQTYSIIFF